MSLPLAVTTCSLFRTHSQQYSSSACPSRTAMHLDAYSSCSLQIIAVVSAEPAQQYSRLHSTVSVQPGVPLALRDCAPVAIIVWSCFHDARICMTSAVCPAAHAFCVIVSLSRLHTRALPSSDADSKQFPAGDSFTSNTLPVWPYPLLQDMMSILTLTVLCSTAYR